MRRIYGGYRCVRFCVCECWFDQPIKYILQTHTVMRYSGYSKQVNEVRWANGRTDERFDRQTMKYFSYTYVFLSGFCYFACCCFCQKIDQKKQKQQIFMLAKVSQ